MKFLKTLFSPSLFLILPLFSNTIYVQEPGELSGIALGYGLNNRGFESRQGLGIFLFTTASRPALGPIQSSIQWVAGGSFLGRKAAGA
jgi:hypothetical protein